MPTVTGQHIPGYSPEQHRAVWSGFFNGCQSSGYTVTFGGKTRTVRWLDANRTQLGVLDEAHGEIEVLDAKANHLGIRQIQVTYMMVQKPFVRIEGTGRNKQKVSGFEEAVNITNTALGPLQAVTGGKAHKFTFHGKLVG
jgi:hypothetical protein